MAKVIPHLVESQVSLRKILSPGVSLHLQVRTYILAIQKKSFQSWALGPENFPLKISVLLSTGLGVLGKGLSLPAPQFAHL